MKKGLLFLVFCIYASGLNAQQIFFNTTPFWSSASSPYSTGCGWADINRDGYLDLIVANGNDMSRGNLWVYLNTGGSLPSTPSWSSSDIDYHGHLSIGDINNDGWQDVAVSVYLGPLGFSQKGKLKVYLNNNGTLSSLPSWTSADNFYTFSCALGDADNDGDLDLAAACGESYNLYPDSMRVYYNNNGTLSTTPGWYSRLAFYAMDVTWADIDKNGRLDLVFCGERGPSRVFLNYTDSLSRFSSWVSTDASIYSNSLFVADVNNDNWLDLAVSDNNQLGGTGKFKIYFNNSGSLNTTPGWICANTVGYGSGITLADFNNDSFLDLAGGKWWGPCWIYANNAGTISSSPNWTSSTSTVVEAIMPGDFDNDGLMIYENIFISDGAKKLYYFNKNHIHRLISVIAGSDTVLLANYTFNLENGWITFKNAPANGTQIKVKYFASYDLDFAVSNWDDAGKNLLFKNSILVDLKKESTEIPDDFILYQNFPNPFNSSTNIRWTIPYEDNVKISIYDILGKEIITPVNQIMLPGTYNFKFDASMLKSGIYFYKLTSKSFSSVKKMILQN